MDPPGRVAFWGLTVVLEIDVFELGIGKRNSFEEGLGDAGHGDGVFCFDGTLGDTGIEARGIG